MPDLLEKGYVIVAVDSDTVDYIACARTLAKSLRYWHPSAKICLISDRSQDDPVFDMVRVIPPGSVGQSVDRWCFALSPFHETIKLEADMIISGPIDHWWTALRYRDLVISVGCRDHQDRTATCRAYRQIFDDNDLLDVYNALTYWRYSRLAKDFFATVGQLFDSWSTVRSQLRQGQDHPANTDLIYAMAAELVGRDLCFIPDLQFFRIAHLKHKIMDLPSGPWTQWMTWELIHGVFRVNGFAQHGAVHYHHKDLCRNLETIYDQLAATNTDRFG